MCSVIRNSLEFVRNFFDPAVEVYQFFVVLCESLAIRVRSEHVQRFLKRMLHSINDPFRIVKCAQTADHKLDHFVC